MAIAPILIRKKQSDFDQLPLELLESYLSQPHGLCKFLMNDIEGRFSIPTHKKNGYPHIWFEALWLIEGNNFKMSVREIAEKLGRSEVSAITHINKACGVVQSAFGIPLGIFGKEYQLVCIASDEKIIADLHNQSKKFSHNVKQIKKSWNYAVSRGLINEEIILNLKRNLGSFVNSSYKDDNTKSI